MDTTPDTVKDAQNPPLSVSLLNLDDITEHESPNAFNCSAPDVVFQELPHHISLAFTIHGCPFACAGCHSEHTWDAESGNALTDDAFLAYLSQYQGLISAVVFLGGEWNRQALTNKLKLAKAQGLTTCLYTGGNHVARSLRAHLDFVKLGPWIETLGGLDSTITNQRFIELKDGELWQDRTHWFQQNASSSSQQNMLQNSSQNNLHTTQTLNTFTHQQGVSYASA
ncbi:anaerobic ribonucleoside-triphosphate reductase activating protein [Litoribrevibacter euphylliae]|uniref:Anaerobic ribonucleoside-triphosphate reductase activating protein n=1 Tax=Litoribrevibacter euphylliae TaxID=1834034 RepID=A0ABV7HK68_9GAMM